MGCQRAEEASEGGGERRPSCCCPGLPEPPEAPSTVRLQLCQIAVATAAAAATSFLPSSPGSISRTCGDSHRSTIHRCAAVVHGNGDCGD